jgi:hypothetical protein
MRSQEVHAARLGLALGPIEGNGLVDQHNGNIVLYLVLQAAGIADKAVAIFRERQVPFAFGTDEDFQQLFIYGHDSPF